MEPSYRTKTEYTFDEYKKFCYAVNNKIANAIIMIVLLEICFIILTILTQNLLLIFLIIFYPFMFYAIQNSIIKKTYRSNKLIQDLEVSFEFYSNDMLIKDRNGETKCEYTMFYRKIETKQNFYLMIARNQGYIIKKENCTEELQEFIKNLDIKS